MKHTEKNVSRVSFVATVTLLILLPASSLFHLLILVGIIPFDIIWGGKITNTSQMFLYETFSVIITIVMIVVILLSAGIIKSRVPYKLIKVLIIAMFVIFSLNTIGNFTSENQIEQIVFTPLSFLLALLCLLLIVNKNTSDNTVKSILKS